MWQEAGRNPHENNETNFVRLVSSVLWLAGLVYKKKKKSFHVSEYAIINYMQYKDPLLQN